MMASTRFRALAGALGLAMMVGASAIGGAAPAAAQYWGPGYGGPPPPPPPPPPAPHFGGPGYGPPSYVPPRGGPRPGHWQYEDERHRYRPRCHMRPVWVRTPWGQERRMERVCR